MKRKKTNKKLVVISPPVNLRNERQRVKQLIEAGLEFFHVRKPEFNCRDTEQYLREYPWDMRKKMILHNHYDLTEEYDLRGIHITEKNKGRGYESRYLHRHISISCHHTAELANLIQDYTYAFLSPVLNSLSKQEYPSAFEFNGLKKFFRENKKLPPVIALGGIHPTCLGQTQGIGFSGVALLGAIWPELSNKSDKHSPLNKFMQIQELIEAL